MSLIYAGGNRSAAIANIKAAVAARFTTGPDGVKVLDTESLMAWMLEQMRQVPPEFVPPASQDSVKQAVEALDPRPLVNALNAAIGRQAFAPRADWPQSARSNINEAQVAAVKTMQAELKTLSNQVTAHYAGVFGAGSNYILDALSRFYDQQALDEKVPQGVQRILETRSYIVTWVNDLGEESAPSDAAPLIVIDQNDTVMVARPAVPGDRGITHWRLYRSQSSSTAAAFQLVPNLADEVGFPISQASFTDETLAAALLEVCPTMTWAEPPANLRGLTGMPNGIMAGFFDNTICFCEPYYLFAWPTDYRVTVEHPIVGMAAWGSTLFVGTRGWPYFVSGADSQTMSARKIQTMQACVSARSIVALTDGVVYASPDGLCLADATGVRVITEGLWTREDWQKMRPASIIGAVHDGCYVFRWDSGTATGAYMLDVATGRLATLDIAGGALFTDLVTDTLYTVDGTSIVGLFAGGGRRAGRWRSPRVVLPRHQPFAWLVAYGDFDVPATVRIYADGALWHTATLTSRQPVRLPSGRFLEWEVEVESAERLTLVALASSTEELQEIAQ